MALLSPQTVNDAKIVNPTSGNVNDAAVSNVKLRHVSSRVVTKQRSDADSESEALNVRQRVDHIETKTRELWPDFDASAESYEGAVADQLMPLRLTTKD